MVQLLLSFREISITFCNLIMFALRVCNGFDTVAESKHTTTLVSLFLLCGSLAARRGINTIAN